MRAVIVFVGLALIASVSCKKAVDDVKEDYVIDIMTDGEWFIESYVAGENDITAQFSGFLFRFKEDGTLTGSKGTQVAYGTWEGDIRTYSIISNFPDAGPPLDQLNGTWKVKDSYQNFVVAEMPSSSGVAVLKLRKVE